MSGIDDLDLTMLESQVRYRLPRGADAASRARAHRLLDDQVLSIPGFGDHPCSGFHWDGLWADTTDRRRGRYLHGFLFLTDLPALLAEGDFRHSAQILDLVQRWAELYPIGSAHPMAYHDETTAQRLMGMLAVFPYLESLGPAARMWVHGFLDRTADLLATTEFHAGPNNHGMFQDLALLTYAALASWRPAWVRRSHLGTADDRLMAYFRTCFTAEGVHVENAPSYHVLVAEHLKQHRDLAAVVGLPHANALNDILRRAVTYAIHAVMPSGTYPLVSDTQPTALEPVARNIFADPGFLYAATVGERGRAPADRVLVLPRSGYAIYRSAWGDPDATYVYFSCAYNSGYHKHSDENSLWLRSGGLDLLAEAGPNGYAYDDSLTRYAYSQHAHNTLVVDDFSTPRTDGRHHEVSLVADEVRSDGFTVTGRNARLGHGVVHERAVEVREDDGTTTLVVTDRIIASSEHDYDLLWHVGPGLVVHLTDNGFELTHGGHRRLRLSCTSTARTTQSVHIGETVPHPQGWRFPRFGHPMPSPTVRQRRHGRDVTVVSLIELFPEPTTSDLLPGRPSSVASPPTMVGSWQEPVAPEPWRAEPRAEPVAPEPWRAEPRAEPVAPEPHTVANVTEGGSIIASMTMAGARQFAFKLYRGSTIVDEVGYSAKAQARWSDLRPGRYRVRGFAREASGQAGTAHTSEAVHVP